LRYEETHQPEYLPEQIIATMDSVGIDKSIVFAMSTTTARSIEMAQEAASKYPGRLVPYVYALPGYVGSVLADIDRAISQLGFKGIKLHCGECTVAEHVAGPVFELAAERGVPCLIDYKGWLDVCRTNLEAHPHTKFIIAHLGRYVSTDPVLIDRFICLAEQHPNALVDVSGVVLLDKIQEAVRRLGAARVFWGIDGPHMGSEGGIYAGYPDTVAYARAELDRLLTLDLDSADKAAVLGGSIAALLGI
jgi:hypothetical protein